MRAMATPEPPARPSPFELWRQAGGDRARYRKLLVEHGHLVPLEPGEKPEPLPCGWPATSAREHVASWTDDEWLSVIAELPPDAPVRVGIAHVDRLRARVAEEEENPSA